MADERLPTGSEAVDLVQNFLRTGSSIRSSGAWSEAISNPIPISKRDEIPDLGLARNAEQIILAPHWQTILERLLPPWTKFSPTIIEDARKVHDAFPATLERYARTISEPSERQFLEDETTLGVLAGLAQDECSKKEREVAGFPKSTASHEAACKAAERAKLVYEIVDSASRLL